MKKNVIITIIFGILSISGIQSIQAQGRDLEDVTIISRKERGANESLKYTNHPTYQNMIKANAKEKERIEGLKETDPKEYEKIQKKELETTIANEYMVENFGDVIKLDRAIYSEEGNDLWRNQGFKNQKTQIIVHHTADDFTAFKTTESATKLMQKIYEFHALKKGRGDIGYNFIIGPQGEIFEGRSGGPGVVGAHATRNNVPSIGIALIGNFQIQKPTQEQLDALIKLITALTKKHSINPTGSSIYHKKVIDYPFIKDLPLSNIVGHRHVGSTSCPGKFLEEKLPWISEQVQKKLTSSGSNNNPSNTTETTGITNIPKRSINLSKSQYIKESTFTLTFPLETTGTFSGCKTQDPSIQITSCIQNSSFITAVFKKGRGLSSGPKKFTLSTTKEEIEVGVFFIWQEDLDRALNAMKTRYLISKPLSTKVPMNKIETKITLKDLSQTLQKPVNVLLYEASTNLTGRNMSCNEGCTIVTDSQNINNIKEVSVKSFENQLQINIDGQQLTTSSVKIIASSGNTVDITNYKRASFAGIPRNSFKGSLTIQRDVIRLLDSTGVTAQSVVTNQLSLEDYMKGVAETNDQEHIEKNKVIAMITKNYLLYYLDKKNIHPSIPSRALYNAIDDPRIFQKYVGAGFEKTVKNWQQALDNTQDKFIMYRGFLPILPYFNCSAGFTRSAAEKRGRTDTPWLKSTLDITRCVDFNGHGVGLSGKGAQEMAVKGIGYTTILKYYYPGTETINIKK